MSEKESEMQSTSFCFCFWGHKHAWINQYFPSTVVNVIKWIVGSNKKCAWNLA